MTRYESAAERELREVEALLTWERNPCGKPPLKLKRLQRFESRQEGMPTIGVDCSSAGEAKRRGTRQTMLAILEGAYHHKADFPGDLAGYYEGAGPGGRWIIEVYGQGEAWPRKPRPPVPRGWS